MNLTRNAIALAALAGALAINPAGFAQDNKETKPPGTTPPPAERPGGPGAGDRRGMSVENQMTRLAEQLKLTDEQKPKVKAVLEDQFKQMQAVPQDERRAKMPAIREETNKKMKEVLTPEQFKQYEEYQQQMRQQRRNQGQGTPPAGNPEKPAPKAETPAEKKDAK